MRYPPRRENVVALLSQGAIDVARASRCSQAQFSRLPKGHVRYKLSFPLELALCVFRAPLVLISNGLHPPLRVS